MGQVLYTRSFGRRRGEQTIHALAANTTHPGWRPETTAEGTVVQLAAARFRNRLARREADGSALREPLTEGELRVLRFLPTNLSKREIADELYVSVNTVKTHVKHLYSKLDVQSRRQAVDRSRELGLLTYSRHNR
jgi:ATP/maltotriose-dependent transcriptional regulator MalT